MIIGGGCRRTEPCPYPRTASDRTYSGRTDVRERARTGAGVRRMTSGCHPGGTHDAFNRA
ncbi:hypothetical protein STRIP9103_03704 [Streptomyces ipomoeae 91-03]|uniref:Uncharacterized protein n=1 Tax=Streptomyces ipomoeae 91-03 TaxID=698759 RepID=L1L0K6_9ACTN|nr:hypothetical protein STRIP9103_03704 [Streptomyces ipomoeae 91-03]